MQKNQQYFLFVLIFIVSVLSFLMYLPFLAPLLIALVCSVIFFPIHKKVSAVISKGNVRSSLSSLVTLLLVLFIVLIPLSTLAFQVSVEARSLYNKITSTENSYPVFTVLNNQLENLSGKILKDNSASVKKEALNVEEYIEQGLKFSFTHIDSIFSSAAKILFQIIILVLALFYFFKDGVTLKEQLMKLSPLDDKQDSVILSKLGRAVNAIIRGTILVAIVQGFLAGIGFAIFGVPNPALWGSVAVFSALVPGVGTSLVLVPGIIYLLISGKIGMAIGLAIWSGLAVGLIDNYLGPKLVGGGVGIHPLLILLAVVGGLSVFGPIGFIMGPLLISLLFALFDVYKHYPLMVDSPSNGIH